MAQKQLPEDFKDFIKYLNLNKVRYLLIGGWAVGLYGYPRATKDIDFLIAIEKDNLKKMVKALSDFGGPTTEAKHLSKPGSVFRMGSPPVQIDIINKASGIDFDDCYKRKNIIRVDNIVITVISKDDLIVNKKASGRIQDEADASKLT
ncbi:MAG: nucleotidyltransferase [Chitinispirillia bacterium]